MSIERTSHWGDCTFYSSIINGRPWDGICTCGYGWTLFAKGEGDVSQLVSEERLIQCQEAAVAKQANKVCRELDELAKRVEAASKAARPVPLADAEKLAVALEEITRDDVSSFRLMERVQAIAAEALAQWRKAHPK